jgi:hypothetical protein
MKRSAIQLDGNVLSAELPPALDLPEFQTHPMPFGSPLGGPILHLDVDQHRV